MKKIVVTLIKVVMIGGSLVLSYMIHWSFIFFLVIPAYGMLTESK